MSLCDRCYAPGNCCRQFALENADGKPSFWIADGLGAVYEWLEKYSLPFVPKEIHRVGRDRRDLSWATWWFKCPKLLPDGRCGIYEARPQLCRDFEAGGDSHLCVHMNGVAEAGDPTLGVEFVI